MLPSGLANAFSILIGIGVTLLSIYFTSGEWYSVYKRFQDLGILDADPNRKGRDAPLTAMWLEEIKKAKRSLLFAGVTLSGWFVSAWSDLCTTLPDVLNRINLFEIFILDPSSEGLKVREEDEIIGGETRDPAGERLVAVLTHLKNSMSSGTLKPFWESGKIKAYLYRGTPFSVMVMDDVIYSVTYLPCIADRECPQLKLTANGLYSQQIKQAIDRLRYSQAIVPLKGPEDIEKIIQKHKKSGAPS
jgi:hypothetical protein